MLRAQIAMGVENAVPMDPCGKQAGTIGQDPPLDAIDAPDRCTGESQTGSQKHLAIFGDVALPTASVLLRQQYYAVRFPVKYGQRQSDAFDLAGIDAIVPDRLVEQEAGFEPAHADQPIHYFAASADRITGCAQAQGYDAEINQRRQAAIQPCLGARQALSRRAGVE